MNFHYFISQLQSLAPITLEEQNLLQTRVKEIHFQRGATLLYPEDICKSIYFINEGFFRIYKVDQELETTVNFAGKGEIVTSFYSFIYQKSSTEAIVCESDALVFRLNYYDLLALQDLSPVFLKLHLLFLQQYLLALHQETQDLRSANASQKYLYLCQKYPGIANLVSYKNIASYLGITPPTLSNLLKEL